MVAWDVAELEDPAIAADLVSRACLRERISKGRKQLLIFHADNGNAKPQASRRVACRHAREPIGGAGGAQILFQAKGLKRQPVLGIPVQDYIDEVPRSGQYRPDYPRMSFTSKNEACQWVSPFVNWYNHQHHHSGIMFVTSQQRYCGQAVEISHHRTYVYEQVRELNPGVGHDRQGVGINRRRSGSISQLTISIRVRTYR